jgi:hypothetical protein
MRYANPAERQRVYKHEIDTRIENEDLKKQREHDRRSALARTISEHLQLLVDKDAQPDVSVEKTKPISWLSGLRLPDEQLIKGSWEGRFKVLSIVNGWTIPDAIEGPRRGHYVEDHTDAGMMGASGVEWVEDPREIFDALVTEDGLITSSGNYISDTHAVENTVSVRVYDLIPIEQEIHTPKLTHHGNSPLTIDWPRVAGHLGVLAL